MQRKPPYSNQEAAGQNIMAVILQSLPEEASLTKIEYEGPRIALYSKNPSYMMKNSQLVSNMVNTIKKRIVIRTDESIRKPEAEATKIISQTIPKQVGIAGMFFDPVLGEAVLFVKKPWMLTQVDEDFDSIELAEKTGWKVRIRKAPHSLSVIEYVYKVLGESATERVRFYREVGEKIFRDRLSGSVEASLVTLGGFAEVGRSCLLLSTQESKILLDCGFSLSAKDSLAALPRFDITGVTMEEIDAVVLSHAHLDHTGFLPALFKYGYSGPVYCTEPTLLLASILQRDYVKQYGSIALYSERDIDDAIAHTITLTYGIVTDISPDIKLVLSNSGHILGSSSIHLHLGNGDHNLVYTGDMKFGKTIALDNASWNFPRVETLIVESTYGGKEDVMCSREADARLVDMITKTMEAGGHVLIPTPTVGISQELMLLLDIHRKKADDASPIKKARILVEKIIADATSIYEAYPEFLSKDLRQIMLESESNPFIPSSKSPVIVESASLKRSKPSIILSPSSMLIQGPSLSYLKQIAKDPKNRLILLSYQAIDTPGRAIRDGARQVVIHGEEISLKCQVDKIDGFDSHSDYNQLLNYVSRLRPKLRRILVNHGERPKAQNLASMINKMYKIQTQHPLVQEAIKLL